MFFERGTPDEHLQLRLLCKRAFHSRLGGGVSSPLEQSQDYLLRFIIYLREHANGAIPFSAVGQQLSDSSPVSVPNFRPTKGRPFIAQFSFSGKWESPAQTQRGRDHLH
jgi:hypothetical protein